MKPLNLAAHDLTDPRMEEIQYIHKFTQDFLREIDRNPMEAKKIVENILRPYMAAQLRTISILEEQIGGYIEQNELLLISNAELIHRCKQNNIDMPNFDQIKRDFDAKNKAGQLATKASGVIV